MEGENQQKETRHGAPAVNPQSDRRRASGDEQQVRKAAVRVCLSPVQKGCVAACRAPALRPPRSGSTLKFESRSVGLQSGGEAEEEEEGSGGGGGGGGGGRSVTLTFQPAAPHKENYQTDAAGWWTYLRCVRCESSSEPSVWRKSNTTVQMFNYSERAAFKMILDGRFINKMHIAVVKCVSHLSMIHKSLFQGSCPLLE